MSQNSKVLCCISLSDSAVVFSESDIQYPMHFVFYAPVPDGLDPAEVACLTVNYVTAYQIFSRIARVSPGKRALIHGAAGGTGSAMVELGRLMGLEMYGTASKPKHALVSSLGATPIDYRNEDFVERISSLTGDGVDVVVDPIGGPNLKRSFNTL